MDYEKYRTAQDAIYAGFRAATDALEALAVDPAIALPCAGYIVALRHGASIMEPFAQCTASLRHVVPSLRYDAENGHTTLTVHEKQPLTTFEPNSSILSALCQVVGQIDKKVWQQVRIDFGDWYFSKGSIIVTGSPNDAFWEVGEQIQRVGASYGLELRMPWGAHMTAGRFTAPCNGNTVELLRQRLQTAPTLGTSAPTALHVGYFTTSEAGFALHTVQAFL